MQQYFLLIDVNIWLCIVCTAMHTQKQKKEQPNITKK